MARKGPKPGPINHGTISGWQTHRDRGEAPCKWCMGAKNAYNRAYSDRGRCASGLGWPLAVPHA